MNKLLRIFALIVFVSVYLSACSGSGEDTNNESVSDTLQKDIIKKDSVISAADTVKMMNDSLISDKKKIKKKEKVYKYICPMGCKTGYSDKAGNCPECGMELIENPDFNYKTKKSKE